MLALLATPGFAAGTEKSAADPEAGVVKTGEAFFDAWNQHDMTKMVAHWTEDATLINPAGRVAHGKAEIEKLLEMKVTRRLGSGMAFCGGEMTVDGA